MTFLRLFDLESKTEETEDRIQVLPEKGVGNVFDLPTLRTEKGESKAVSKDMSGMITSYLTLRREKRRQRTRMLWEGCMQFLWLADLENKEKGNGSSQQGKLNSGKLPTPCPRWPWATTETITHKDNLIVTTACFVILMALGRKCTASEGYSLDKSWLQYQERSEWHCFLRDVWLILI